MTKNVGKVDLKRFVQCMIPLQRLDSSGERKQEISCAMIGNILDDGGDTELACDSGSGKHIKIHLCCCHVRTASLAGMIGYNYLSKYND